AEMLEQLHSESGAGGIGAFKNNFAAVTGCDSFYQSKPEAPALFPLVIAAREKREDTAKLLGGNRTSPVVNPNGDTITFINHRDLNRFFLIAEFNRVGDQVFHGAYDLGYIEHTDNGMIFQGKPDHTVVNVT